MSESKEAIYKKRPRRMNFDKDLDAKHTNKDRKEGTLEEVIEGADVFIGVSVGGALTPEMVKKMNKDPIIFAMANADPEILPDVAKEVWARIIGTGRSG